MNIFQHSRFKIFSESQHPLKHDLSALAYTNARFPTVSTLTEFLDYIGATLFPQYKETVATPADLAAVVGMVTNDYVIVTDDGDGKSAGYVYSVIEGVGTWHKRYDPDWSMEGIFAEVENRTQYMYVHKYGQMDADASGVALAGVNAGQHIYGGTDAGSNLILHANSANADTTGKIYAADDLLPQVDSTFSLGSTAIRWLKVWTDEVTSGTLTMTGGSITDSSGAISFDNENLSTTGTITGSNLSGTNTGDVTLAANSGLSLVGQELDTTVFTDLVKGVVPASGGGTSNFIRADGSWAIPPGTGATRQLDNLTGVAINTHLLPGVTNSVTLGDATHRFSTLHLEQQIRGPSDIIVDVGNAILYGPSSAPSVKWGDYQLWNGFGIAIDYAAGYCRDLVSGAITFSWVDQYLKDDAGTTQLSWSASGINLLNITNGVNTISVADLLTLRSTPYRDSGRTTPAVAGDTLFWSGTQWLSSAPDTEIDHAQVSGLTTTDAGHTQFVMLAGRSGGQAVQGGTAASELLTLESTSHVTKGTVQTKDSFLPFTDASFAATWSGLDLGDATHYFRDVYTKGEFKGLRLENYTVATLPASSGSAAGRLVFATDSGNVYVDNGSTMKLVGGGGGGGSLQWVEDVNAPIASVASGNQVYTFEDAVTQELWALIRVPSSYSAGSPINLRLTAYSAEVAGTMLMTAQCTLIRTGTDAISDTTNQRTTTNTAITLSGGTASIPQAIVLDISDSSGQVNGVAVAPGDLLKVKLYRDTATDTAAGDVLVPVYGAEVTFV